MAKAEKRGGSESLTAEDVAGIRQVVELLGLAGLGRDLHTIAECHAARQTPARYEVVHEMTPGGLAASVERLLADGWQLLGTPVFAASWGLCQAVVLPGRPDKQ